MTELDSSVGSDEKSPSLPTLVEVSSQLEEECSDVVDSSNESSKTTSGSSGSTCSGLPRRVVTWQGQLQSLHQVLEETSDENEDLQNQLTNQMHLYEALVTEYRQLQEQFGQQVRLNASQQARIERLVSLLSKQQNPQEPNKAISKSTAANTPTDLVEKSSSPATAATWTTSTWWLVGMGAVVVVTVVGGGVVMYQAYHATAAAAAQVATHATLVTKAAVTTKEHAKLSTKAAARSSQEALRSEQAAARSSNEALRSGQAARVSAQAAARRANHTWVERRMDRFGGRPYYAVDEMAHEPRAGPFSHHHWYRHHHHHRHHSQASETERNAGVRPEERQCHANGHSQVVVDGTNLSSEAAAAAMDRQESGSPSTGTPSGSSNAERTPGMDRWMLLSPEAVSCGVKIGLVAAVPLLLGLMGL